MRIVSSEIIEQVPQADGSIGVTEKHNYDDGHSSNYSYIAPANFDLQAVANDRAANINAKLALIEQQKIEANNFEVPISQRDFIDLIPPAGLVALRETAATDPILFEAIKYLELPGPVFKSVTTARLTALVANESMSQTLVDTIMSNWAAKYG